MSFVCCSFKYKDPSKKMPMSIMTDLAEVGYLLVSVGDNYQFSYSETEITLTCWQECMWLDTHLDELLEQGKLGYRHLRAFFWVKRHMSYRGDSHNHNDWDSHPDDFFEYVEDVLREFRGGGYK